MNEFVKVAGHLIRKSHILQVRPVEEVIHLEYPNAKSIPEYNVRSHGHLAPHAATAEGMGLLGDPVECKEYAISIIMEDHENAWLKFKDKLEADTWYAAIVSQLEEAVVYPKASV